MKCAKCGRELTDPESIARGYGPVCAGQEEDDDNLPGQMTIEEYLKGVDDGTDGH
jgi:hypothetical protein